MSAAKFKIESGVQLLTRLTKKPNLDNFYPKLFRSGPKSGEVIEVISDNCCASHLIIDIISEALIKTRYNDVPAGVLIFNTNGINYDDLFSVTKQKLLFNMQNIADNAAFDTALRETVTNLYIVDIYDATQFYTTIHNLESILIEYSNISLVVFNTLTAFYWSEQGHKITRMDLYIKNLINLIQKVTKEYKTICLYTRPEYFCTNKDTINIPVEINYQIQIVLDSNCKDNYKLIVKGTSSKSTEFFKIDNGNIKWL